MKNIENPFAVIGRIKPEYFCDRKTESERLIKLLRNGNNVLLKSDRRMGKTGLVQFCFDKAELLDHYYTFFIDILHTSCLQELVHELGRAVYEQTVPRGKKMTQSFVRILKSISGKMGFDGNTGLPTFSLGLGDIEQPEYTLKEIFQYLQNADKPCIVAIDEFQQIGKYPEKNVEALLRGQIQQVNNCNFVFAGSEKHLLGMMFESGSRPFYKSADNMDLLPIVRDVYVDFICQMFEKQGKKIEKPIAEVVYDAFEGHTYYVQKTMNEAFSNTDKGTDCSIETIILSIQNILEDNGTYYRETLSNLPASQKSLLYAIAIDGWASQITSAAFVKRHKLLSPSSVQAAIKKLLGEELVVEHNKRYRVNDRFLGIWIRRMMGIPLSSLFQ
ncbi:MAG: ATP-binding protein [Bacteroidales bacterium]|nr:ATP-binding protein [Bacteroidales bacterium]